MCKISTIVLYFVELCTYFIPNDSNNVQTIEISVLFKDTVSCGHLLQVRKLANKAQRDGNKTRARLTTFEPELRPFLD